MSIKWEYTPGAKNVDAEHNLAGTPYYIVQASDGDLRLGRRIYDESGDVTAVEIFATMRNLLAAKLALELIAEPHGRT